jgi:hypothetical protein
MRPFTIALLTLTILGGDMAQSDYNLGFGSVFDPTPYAQRGDKPKAETRDGPPSPARATTPTSGGMTGWTGGLVRRWKP